MRILLLNYEYPPLGGGGGVAMKCLAEGFVAAGHQVDVITSGYKGLPAEEQVGGVAIYRVKTVGRKGSATATWLAMASFLFFGFIKGIRLCRKQSYDLLNTHFVLPTGPLGYILSRLFRFPNILSIHGGDIYDPSKKHSPHRHWYYRRIIAFLLKKADVVVAQSENTKENAKAYYAAQESIPVIPLPYKPEKYPDRSRSALGLVEEQTYLIAVGRMVIRKGFHCLLESLIHLPETVSLILVGDGPERKTLEQRAVALGIQQRVVFCGRVSEEKKYQFLRAADIYVLSSLHEGFGIVLQEAMHAGLPIVATNIGGQMDMLEHEQNALLIPVQDATAIAQAVQRVQSDAALRVALCESHTQSVASWSPQRITQQYLNLVV